ncbi:glycoside hydrolase family 15 protein [Backusella circina FSU 941]|nr:glycoside hydrolase family 15 protein [Backusella circina FSU 941]
MLNNINPSGTVKGFFAASLSTHEPDYFYAWVRDSALVARVLYGIQRNTEDILYDYTVFQSNIQNTQTVCNCLGEPKFNPNGTGYVGNWGRPQNDGPAERAIVMLQIASSSPYQYNEFLNTTIIPMILRDLYYIVSVWEQPCYDLWEEIEGVHFYTLMVMRRALLDGANYFHSHEVNVFLETAENIRHRIESFWDPAKNYVMATQDIRNGVEKASGLDASTLLAVNLASRDDGFFTPGSDKILATAARLESEFAHLFPINLKNNNNNNMDLGTAIGRYPEDIYDGYRTSIGNPWFLTTAGYAELYYLAAHEFQKNGVTINKINRAFFAKVGNDKLGEYKVGSAELERVVQKTRQAGDRFLKTIQYHQNQNGSMSEQFDRNDGFMKGARDLTWSHAAFLAAIAARSGTPID